jgi:hypothetical protein
MMVTVPSVITAQTGLRILPGVTSILETDLTARKSAAMLSNSSGVVTKTRPSYDSETPPA